MPSNPQRVLWLGSFIEVAPAVATFFVMTETVRILLHPAFYVISCNVIVVGGSRNDCLQPWICQNTSNSSQFNNYNQAKCKSKCISFPHAITMEVKRPRVGKLALSTTRRIARAIIWWRLYFIYFKNSTLADRDAEAGTDTCQALVSG